jgi:transketolase
MIDDQPNAIKKLKMLAFHTRKNIIETIITNGEGHVGGALSSTDIIAALFGHVMNEPGTPSETRDRFLLSAGHKCLAVYGVMAELGIIDKKLLKTYNQLNTPLSGHTDMKKLRQIDFSTGSLGHGLSIGNGMALASVLKGTNFKVYVLMGDGEQGEGSIWEAATYASHRKLDNLIGIIDRNQLQINGKTQDVLNTRALEDRYSSFGWSVRTIDGHDMKEIVHTLSSVPFEIGKPSMIIADTIKGKGLSFAENNVGFHHWHADDAQIKQAIIDLEKIWEDINND